MKRYILTGAPGAGKTSILLALGERGYPVVEEAATAVIAAESERGKERAWEDPGFIDKITALQRRRQLDPVPAGAGPQLFDRSPVCTLALSLYLGFPVSPALSAELDRVAGEGIFERTVFFVGDLGFIERTAARQITAEGAKRFEQMHVDSYLSLGYELIDVPRAGVTARADLVESHLTTLESTA